MSDLISRQDAIDAICTEGTRLERNGTVAMVEIKQWCVDILEGLPSVQSEKVNEQIKWERDIAVQQLQALGYGLGEKIRTDSDTISRQAAIDAVNSGRVKEDGMHLWRCERNETLDAVVELLEAVPSAQSDFCEGCKHIGLWENEVEYGCSSPCTGCKRRASDNYER